MTVALGTSMPTSITEVATSTSASPDTNAAMASCLRLAGICPWISSTRWSLNSVFANRSASAAAARAGRRPGEQGDRDESAEQAVERGQVLLGQRLGGRHERGLRTVLDGAEHRAQGDNGLAGAHLSHQQALHRFGAGEVRVDLLERLALVVRGLERERRSPGVHQLAD